MALTAPFGIRDIKTEASSGLNNLRSLLSTYFSGHFSMRAFIGYSGGGGPSPGDGG